MITLMSYFVDPKIEKERFYRNISLTCPTEKEMQLITQTQNDKGVYICGFRRYLDMS